MHLQALVVHCTIVRGVLLYHKPDSAGKSRVSRPQFLVFLLYM